MAGCGPGRGGRIGQESSDCQQIQTLLKPEMGPLDGQQMVRQSLLARIDRRPVSACIWFVTSVKTRADPGSMAFLDQ